MRIWHLSILGLLMGLASGCDDRPQTPQRVANNTTQPATKVEDFRPKASEMLSGPRKTIQLSDYPLTMDVPSKWNIENLGPVTLLQGPIPDGPLPEGTIHVMLSRQPAFSREAVASLEASEKKAAAEKPQQVRLREFRDLGGARLFEKQVVDPPDPSNHLPAMLKWTITVYVESSKDQFTPYVLKFIDLTLEQYEKDKPVLQQMVGSLKFDLAPALK